MTLGPEAAAPLSDAELRMKNNWDRDGECIMPAPADAGPPSEPKVKGRRPDHSYMYRDARGGLLGCVLRWEACNGERKEFRPITYWRDQNGKCGWRLKSWPQCARPLYGLDRLAAHPAATVLLVEGEKTADAVERGPLADAFKWGAASVIGITWPGGGRAIDHADFSPLAGRDIVILPDAHPPGEETADKLIAILEKVGPRKLRRWKAPAGAKDAWDIADAIPPGWTPEALVKSMMEAPDCSIVLTLPAFLATRIPPDYLVDRLFQRGYLYSITAMTGGGKTAVALLLAIAVADIKRRWKFGPHEVEHGRVVYVTRENPEDVKNRLIGMAARMGFDPKEFAQTFLVIQDVADIEKEFERIKREIKPFGEVALIILDTSAALFVGEDENSPIEMLKHARTQRRLITLPGRPTVIALNHPIKKPSGPEQLLPRGGGGYLNEIDGNFTLWAHDGKLSDFHWVGKLRGPDFETITFRMAEITTTNLTDSKGRLMPTVMAQLVTDADIEDAEEKAIFQENRLLKAIAAKPEASIAELAQACGWVLKGKDGQPDKPYRSLVRRVLDRLLKDKRITKEGRRHSLTKVGKAAVKEDQAEDD